MKQYGEAATLQLILDSGVLPEIVNAYSKPIAEAMGQIDSITMYGEGNTAKLTEEITKNGTQIFDGLEKATGLDIKSILAGYLGGRLIHKDSKEENK
jgi:flotillin